MDAIERLRLRLEAARLGDLPDPVAMDAAEAVALARGVADDLAVLPEIERLRLLANLADVCAALSLRVDRLETEMEENRRLRGQMRISRTVCAQYAASRPPGPTRRN